MHHRDDDLADFEANGARLPPADRSGYVAGDGADIWFADFGEGPAVVLLHGGMGNAGNFAYQLPALRAAGYRVIAIDSRGQGRSSRDGRPFSYAQMAEDSLAVLDRCGVDRAAFIGWSDGACTALLLADAHPERAAGVFFFACNMDPGGTRPFVFIPVIGRCLERNRRDYAALSPTPDDFDATFAAVGLMQGTQPDYSAEDLARITVPVTVALGEHDEFILPGHADYLARAIPGAERVNLPGVSHFAMLQRPDVFNAAVLAFLAKVLPVG